MDIFKNTKATLLNIRNFHSITHNVTEEVISIVGAQTFFDNNFQKGVCEKKCNSEEIIVSLTSFGIRAYNVYLTISSLMHQSYKVNRIILWLSEKEFSSSKLPATLVKLQALGLEVKFYKDIKSFKKLIPTLQESPQTTIITVDDDIIYPYIFIEQMVINHRRHPNEVLFTRGHRIKFNKKKSMILPYRSWFWNVKEFNCASLCLFPTGCGGVLYPPNCFHSDILNEEKFMSLTPTADDIWFKVMTVLNNVKCRQIEISHQLVTISNTQSHSLSSSNNGIVNRNDIQLNKIIEAYPEFLSILLKEKI